MEEQTIKITLSEHEIKKRAYRVLEAELRRFIKEEMEFVVRRKLENIIEGKRGEIEREIKKIIYNQLNTTIQGTLQIFIGEKLREETRKILSDELKRLSTLLASKS